MDSGNGNWVAHDVCGSAAMGIVYILLVIFGVYLLINGLAWMQGL